MDLKPPIFVGADHAGWHLKEAVREHLVEAGFVVTDMGNQVLDPDDDYPVFAKAVAKVVANIENARGLLFCGSAQGMSMCANKVRGVRAALGWSPLTAKSSREHNNSNVLCLPGSHLDQHQALVIVDAWLAAAFSQGERHMRRLEKMAELETQEATNAAS